MYLDAILILSKSEQEHVQHVRTVLQRRLENQLFVKAEKCDFNVSEVFHHPELGQYSSRGPERIINFTPVPPSSASSPAQRNYNIGNQELLAVKPG